MFDFWNSFAEGETLYHRLIDPVCAKHDLTRTQFHILMFLANHPQFNTAASIVEKRHISKSHVSISVRGLQDRGFLKGEYRGKNRKNVYLTLCPAAQQAVSDGQAAQQMFGKILLRGFTAEQAEEMRACFSRIRQNIADYSGEWEDDFNGSSD